MKTFVIDFVRQVLEQKLLSEKLKNPKKYYGGKNEVNLMSFYEQLQKDDEVVRFQEIYQDLVDQQNRTGLIMNGTIIAPENPTITNISQSLIVPMTFTCSFRLTLANRDIGLETIDHLIECLKGRKQDIALLDNGALFMVGTICNEIDGEPKIVCGDYIGDVPSNYQQEDVRLWVLSRINELSTQGISVGETGDYYLYFKDKDNKLKVYYHCIDAQEDYIFENESEWVAIKNSGADLTLLPLFPQEHESFEKYSLSLSFDSLRCDEPRNLNAVEYCVISFGGSATLVSEGIVLGNSMTKLGIKKDKIPAKTDITINSDYEWLEPLELSSSSNADTQINQLLSNKFITNTHTDNLTLSLQYTFVLDKNIKILREWFKYARYGTQADISTLPTTKNGITPNIIYDVKELWSSWGVVDVCEYKAKIINNIEVENSESDVIQLTIPFQLQGENN